MKLIAKRKSAFCLAIMIILLGFSAFSDARVRSNTMVRFPQDLYASDLTGDSITEWIHVDGSNIHISDMKYEPECLAHIEFPDEITRIVTGDFLGYGRDMICGLLANNMIYCIDLSFNEDGVRSSWIQGSFIWDFEEVLVGDFDGDGRDELLVYNPHSGRFSMHGAAIINDSLRFWPHQTFNLGHLDDHPVVERYCHFLVGNFGNAAGEGIRDDLLMYCDRNRRITRFSARENQNGHPTFWWAFTTDRNVFNASEEVTVANVLGNDLDQLVFHDKDTGEYRFCKCEYDAGQLKPFDQTSGQLYKDPGASLYWVRRCIHPNEPGSENRHDAVVYQPENHFFYHYSARNVPDAGRTYWWAYRKGVNAYVTEMQLGCPDQPLIPYLLSGCVPVSIELDLDGDNAEETYQMVSLAHCNGRNYVTPEKEQDRTNCGVFSITATMETMMGIKLDQRRPVTEDHPALDFSPVNFSETYSGYARKQMDVLVGNEGGWYGTTLEAHLPRAEHYQEFSEIPPQKADAIEARYGSQSDYCVDIDSHIDTANCIYSIAKLNNMIFTSYWNPSGVKCRLYITSNKCIDTYTNEAVECPSMDYSPKYGDRIQIDYQAVDEEVMYYVKHGFPVRMTIKWDFRPLERDIYPEGLYYRFRTTVPRKLANYQADDGYEINGNYYDFTSGAHHSVMIVGYLLGGNGADYYIIKNSHKVTQNFDSFFLIRTPGTSGGIEEDHSTKRVLFLSKPSTSKYHIHQELYTLQFDPSVQSVDDLYTYCYDDRLMTNDADGDTVIDMMDNCPYDDNIDQKDSDLDFVGDACDPCPFTYDRYQMRSDIYLEKNDTDNDGIPNLCDPD